MSIETNTPEDIVETSTESSDTENAAAAAPVSAGAPAESMPSPVPSAADGPHAPLAMSSSHRETPSPAAPPSEDTGEPSFAEMLAEHERKEEPHTRLSPGLRVSVRIVAVTDDTVFVSTGSKVDGIVDREELEVDGQLPYAVGDTVELYVVTATSQEVKLSKILRGAGNLAALEEARDAGLPVEGKVTAQVKGGYAVEIMKRRAFCPAGQIDFRPPADPEEPVGKTFAFLISKLEKGGRNIVVSRRNLLEREQAENREAVLAQISIGDTVEAVITRLTPFGAFAELAPGVEGLIHLSELSWTRVAQADEAVSPGDRVRAKVLSIDKGEKGTRISLSSKQVTEDPWKEAASRLSSGDVVSGKVIRTTPFGAFVEVLPGVEGLVHISELSYERRVLKTEEVTVPGDIVTVKVKEVDPAKKRISLSLRDVAGNPWDTATDTLSIGADVVGTVEKRAPFGLFITLAPGITGLLPNAVVQNSPARKSIERLNSGESVSVRIKSIDVQSRRISLAPAGDADEDSAAEEKDWKKHAAPKQPAAPSMGTLGMALQAAMKDKKK